MGKNEQRDVHQHATGRVRHRDARHGRFRLRGHELPRTWGDWLGRIAWELFATLSFDPKRVFPVSRELAVHEGRDWLGIVAHLCRRRICWALAAERGDNGLWHVHTVIEGAGRPNLGTLAGVWRMRNGFASVKPVYATHGVAMYTTKAALDGEIILSDTLTSEKFATIAPDIVVPLVREDE